ncbi:hypothetical protein GCM10022279_03350 [Comamonas faecalis]|uniref:Sensor histidine kinase n=1 Tax=Comamonas faecalis TaxID=1387849 RepID=A0ABP7QIN8_9BURK
MKIDGYDILRHGLQVLAFCCVVAVFTTMIWSTGGYWRQLLYSVCIGGLTWLTIEFGRLLVPSEHCHRDPTRDGHGWPKGWRGLLLTAIGIAVGFLGGSWLAARLLGETTRMPTHDLRLALLVTIAAGVTASFYFHARGRQAALQAHIAAAERDAAQARLMLLQSQLKPHMLFNTLANLRALISVDPAAAQQMLDCLVDYLRATLGGSRATLHPLADEFARLADYLELIAVRMGPRLTYRLDLPDALRAAQVPTLLLQPLVENAIRHGLEPQVAGGNVQVSAQATADGTRLALQVRNSGAPLAALLPHADTAPGRSFGLTQVRERLRTLYGDEASFELTSDDAGHTCANITLPLQ